MTTIVKRYPTFEIELYTQDTPYILKYDTQKQISQKTFEEAIMSFSVKNAMADDSPAFSLVISSKEKWDKIVNANDLIRIRVFPDVTKGVPDNPYIMVGMISDIKKEGEYGHGTLVYRITGQAMTKALINFNVGVIQEVSVAIPNLGWLPDDPKDGLKFSQNTAAGIGNELMERFIYKYAQYKFSNGKGLKDYLVHKFTSWAEDETLADPSPFVNYQGSLRQFLTDITAKPFNELFFEYTKEGQCVAFMRPTPFDPDKWGALHSYRFTSDIVVQESFGKNDNEMFSIYVVQAPNINEYSNMDLGVFPKFHPELIKRYGYKRIDAQNRYLLTPGLAGTDNQGTNAGTGTGTTPPSGNGTGTTNPSPTPATQPTTRTEPKVQQPKYDEVVAFIAENKLQDKETLRLKENEVKAQLVGQFPSMPPSLVTGIVDSLKDGKLSREVYTQLVTSAGGGDSAELTQEKGVANAKLEKFTQKLFNWYCENANFYSGDIRVLGDPAYRVGSRILYDDFEQDTVWEFYLESVQHEFSFDGGYTTILGVTRGLPDQGAKRFSNLWGKAQEFVGGYLGEKTTDELLEMGKNAMAQNGAGGNGNNGGTGGGGWGGGTGGAVAMQALNTARQMTSKPSVYVFGGGRSGSNPFLNSPIKIDCSSFVWWCYNVNGVQLKGGATGMTTDTIAGDQRLQVVSARGSDKKQAMSKIQTGDIIYFDTYKSDGHIGIYSGNGKFIGSQSTPGIHEEDLNTSYWQKVFNGHVRRYSG